jgi:hypothetical protein
LDPEGTPHYDGAVPRRDDEAILDGAPASVADAIRLFDELEAQVGPR